MPDYFLISGGYVYDPANGIDGQVKDLWIEGGQIVAPPSDPAIKPTRTLNAGGLVVMPGGIGGPRAVAACRPHEGLLAQ